MSFPRPDGFLQTSTSFLSTRINTKGKVGKCLGWNREEVVKEMVSDLWTLLASYQKQVDNLLIDARSQGGCAKIPDPPTFTDSESKQDLKMWVN